MISCQRNKFLPREIISCQRNNTKKYCVWIIAHEKRLPGMCANYALSGRNMVCAWITLFWAKYGMCVNHALSGEIWYVHESRSLAEKKSGGLKIGLQIWYIKTILEKNAMKSLASLSHILITDIRYKSLFNAGYCQWILLWLQAFSAYLKESKFAKRRRKVKKNCPKYILKGLPKQ